MMQGGVAPLTPPFSALLRIRRRGHVLVKEYIEDGHGGKYLHRPALDQLREDAKTANVNHLNVPGGPGTSG
jgi:hypothetical protein